MKTLLISITSAFMLGCSHTLFQPASQIVCEEVDRPTLYVYDFQFQLGFNEYGENIIGFDGENYRNFLLTLTGVSAYIEYQEEEVKYYKGCIDRHNKKGER
jgi:hypothetical protein